MRHKVAIDMRYVENINSGLSRFSINIFNNLIENSINDNIDFFILLPPKIFIKDINNLFYKNISNVEFIYSKYKRGLRWKIPFVIFDLSLYFKLKNKNIDIFISPYIDPPFLPGIKVISTIHDLIFLRVDNYFNNFALIKRFFSEIRILLTLAYSNHVITVSNTTKNNLINRYKYLPFFKKKLNKVTVIYNGISKFNKITKYQRFNKINFSQEYFLYVGDRRNHKNIFYTIDLIKNYNYKYNRNFYLVIAGSNDYKNFKLTKYIRSNTFVKEIINPSDQLLDYLYMKSISLILLSLDEGFGIPVIEAAYRSKKIILSDISVFKEIAPEGALLLDLKKGSNHLELLNQYLNKTVYFDSQTMLRKWSWNKSSLKLKGLLLSKLLD